MLSGVLGSRCDIADTYVLPWILVFAWGTCRGTSTAISTMNLRLPTVGGCPPAQSQLRMGVEVWSTDANADRPEGLRDGVVWTRFPTCGASVLLQDPRLGSVTPEGDCPALADAPRESLRHGSLSQEERKRIRDWSACISGCSAAQYLLNVVSSVDAEAPPPEAPWLTRRA